MKKKYRIRKRRDFSYTYRKGKSIASYCLVLIFRKNNSDLTRFGFSISKKFGKAVKRNRIKRQLREICRLKMEDIESGYDLIFVVRKAAKNADFRMLENQVESLLRKAGLLRNSDRV